jgi:hypothetical protein
MPADLKAYPSLPATQRVDDGHRRTAVDPSVLPAHFRAIVVSIPTFPAGSVSRRKKETAMATTHAWQNLVHDMRDEMHDIATIGHVGAARQAYLALWATFIVFPLVFGLDKFATVMTDTWETYLATWANNVIPGTAGDAMLWIGAVEIVLAVLVLAVPRVGGDLLALFFLLTAINLFAIEGMAMLGVAALAGMMCALAMARMSTAYHHKEA